MRKEAEIKSTGISTYNTLDDADSHEIASKLLIKSASDIGMFYGKDTLY